jgi:hypothetical protein
LHSEKLAWLRECELAPERFVAIECKAAAQVSATARLPAAIQQ